MKTLGRFKKAQRGMYKQAFNEIKKGKKVTHWIWYIFPQLEQLGQSEMSIYYGIKNIKEAKKYYNNTYLRNNLLNICNALNNVKNKTITDIVGYDDIKVHSCITLFLEVDKDNKILNKTLDKYFNGEKDINTILLIQNQ